MTATIHESGDLSGVTLRTLSRKRSEP